MSNNAGFLIVSAILAIWGLTGIAAGNMKLGTGPRGYGKPIVVYQGRGLGAVMVIISIVIAVINLLALTVPPKLSAAKATQYTYISLGVLVVLFILMSAFSAITTSVKYDADEAPQVKPVSLHEAAKFLKMSDDEVLQMAQNGGIESRQVNGQYMFDKEILLTFRDAMESLKY